MKIYRIAQSEITVYHGTNDVFEGFDSSKSQSGYYPGFYVTSSKDLASTYGSKIIYFTLQPSKYYEISNNKDAEDLKQKAKLEGHNVTIGSGYGECEYLKKIGYHGIKRGSEYIVFDPETNLS